MYLSNSYIGIFVNFFRGCSKNRPSGSCYGKPFSPS